MNAHATLAKGVRMNTIQGKEVLFSLRSGETFGLNDTAAALLRAMLTSDLESAATECASRFDAPLEEIRGDMKELADELVGMGLIVVG